jgi:hypothetical protein
VKPEIAEIWALALESGLYDQGRGQLVLHHTLPTPPKYCCLGVLCDLANKAGVKTPFGEDEKPYGWNFGTNGATLPECVIRWAGMETPTGEFGPSPIDCLMFHNDNGHPFSGIAAIIREHVEQL